MHEEYKYKKLRKLGQELGIPTFEAFLELEVTKDGKVIHKHKQRSHSWTRNAYNALFAQLAAKGCTDNSTFGAGHINVKVTSGSLQGGSGNILGINNNDAAGDGYWGDAGVDTKGIVVGIGTNAESFEDYILQTLVDNGTGSGEISYISGITPAYTYTAGTKVAKVEHVRYFNNNSGGSIVIAEVGIYAECLYSGSTVVGMVARDLLGATVTVPDTGQLKITYTIELTYPS